MLHYAFLVFLNIDSWQLIGQLIFKEHYNPYKVKVYRKQIYTHPEVYIGIFAEGMGVYIIR